MKKKTILVNLIYLKDLYRGFGQIALNYGNYFAENYRADQSDYQLYLLMPKKMFGMFGNEVKYISSTNWFRRHCRFLMPNFDVWHNLQYPSRFRPAFPRATKYIFTLHDFNTLTIEYEGSKKSIEKNRRRLQRNINMATALVSISEFTKNETDKYMNLHGKSIQVIQNAVEDITNLPCKQPDVEIKSPFLFSISVFRPTKNFHTLLDMMKLMPDKHLYIAGKNTSDYGKMIKARIANEKIENVHLLGMVSTEEKAWLYRHCEAFVFPSILEGFGLPIVEALQFGKPVICAKRTSLIEIGDKYVGFWEHFEPEYMKQTVEDYLANFSAQKAEQAKEYANLFSYEKYFEQYEKLYRELING
ncbi:MAG: glycosyltransferase family 4 protein [Paludibacter sp.]|jgi:glycosyltransferase involved in cell wall biosynthesis|nr:glycosyltransferase family 4 protein [Paludibacter sp.]